MTFRYIFDLAYLFAAELCTKSFGKMFFLAGTLQVIDRSFGFDTAVEEAQRAINAAHVESESIENGIGFVKLMGRYSGKLTACSKITKIVSKSLPIFTCFTT